MSDRERLIQLQEKFGILGRSEAIYEIIETIDQVAKTDIAVLVEGESGSGKELIARAIHNHSNRLHEPLVTVNCGAIPTGILESELFGHKKGAFTGADQEREGYFETADGGTIFLDEIGEMPLETQVRLLRVIEQGEFMKVGGSENIYVDVRVIAASNRDLSEEVQKGDFRKDLYYRLKAITVTVPSLRERKVDIPLLVEHFAEEFCRRNGIPNKGFTEEAYRELKRYNWPGNIRELRNFVESIVLLEKGNRIEAEHIRRYLHKDEMAGVEFGSEEEASNNLPVHLDKSVEEAERELILQQLFLMRKDLAELKAFLYGNQESAQNQRPVPRQLPERISQNLPSRILSDYEEVVQPEEYAPAEEADQINGEEEIISESAIGNITIREMERELIKKTLEAHDHNRRKTAKTLDLSERTLYRKIKEYDL